MEQNKFIINPSTGDINQFLIASGYATIDCNYEKVYRNILDSSTNYNQTDNIPIKKSDIVYLTNFPSKAISYEKMVSYGKDKYFWDALGQKLYIFEVLNYPEFNYKGEVDYTSELPLEDNEYGDLYIITTYNKKYFWNGEIWLRVAEPFVKQHQTIVGVSGTPLSNVSINTEFSTEDGTFNEVFLDIPTNNVIRVKGHPDKYAERPYTEDIYYYDTVNNKYYSFVSNYTKNKNNWYYDNTLETSTLYEFVIDSKSFTPVNDVVVMEGNPNSLITITPDFTDVEESKISIDDINKLIAYCDKTTETLYLFDYGQYFVNILYSNIIYERFFEFYRKLQDVYFDISSTRKIKNKEIYYVSGHPRKIKNPQEDRYYYDSKNQIYYEYDANNQSWSVIPQENLLIPQTFFPHTHGEILKKVTLMYYNIIDCYTKKEVHRKIPVIPGYISAFRNDVGYIYEHQDITVKQDKLTEDQLNCLSSGVTVNKVNSWDAAMEALLMKQDKLTEDQLNCLRSGINQELVEYFDYLGYLLNQKATKSNKLKDYGITDAYDNNDLDEALTLLIYQLNNAP